MATVTAQSESRSLDEVASVMAHLIAPKVYDNSFGSNATWDILTSMAKRIDWGSGDDTIQIPLNLAIPGQATSYSGYGVLPTDPTRTHTAALFTASEYAMNFTVSQRELDSVAGSTVAMAQRMGHKLEVAIADLKDRLNRDLWRDGTTVATDFPGFAAAVASDPSADTYGGVASASNTDWQNKATNNGNSTADIVADYRTAKINATIGSRKPRVIIGGRTERNVLESKMTVDIDTDPILVARGGAGSPHIETLKFGESRFVVDERFVVYGGGTNSCVVMLNMDTWCIAVKPSTFGSPVAGAPGLRMDKLQRSQNQTVFTSYVRWIGVPFTTDRRLNAVVYGLATA